MEEKKEPHTFFVQKVHHNYFSHLPLAEHEYLVVVCDGVEPVRDGEDGALGEGVPDGGLDEEVGADVHGGGGLVKQEDAVLPEEGPGKYEEEGRRLQ